MNCSTRFRLRNKQRVNRDSNQESKNIPRIRSAGVDDLYDDEGVQEVAGDHVRAEGRRFLLKYDSDNVVADVSFALQLLRVARTERQQRGHVEKHFSTSKYLVHRKIASLTVASVQTTAITV